MGEKVRINISVDKVLLNKAKKRLNLFGGKLSTLFNAYLSDFVKSSETPPGQEIKKMSEKIKELENRIKILEKERLK